MRKKGYPPQTELVVPVGGAITVTEPVWLEQNSPHLSNSASLAAQLEKWTFVLMNKVASHHSSGDFDMFSGKLRGGPAGLFGLLHIRAEVMNLFDFPSQDFLVECRFHQKTLLFSKKDTPSKNPPSEYQFKSSISRHIDAYFVLILFVCFKAFHEI